MIKECLQSLLYSPASLISTVTLCLLSLMQIAERECSEQVKEKEKFSVIL